MSLDKLLKNNLIKSFKPSLEGINSLRDVIERDIKDSKLEGLSSDRKYATAYNAALQLSKLALMYNGLRVLARSGHHRTTFEAVRHVIGDFANPFADYFDICRRKRNKIDYDYSSIASEGEAEEIIKRIQEYQVFIEKWIAANFSEFQVSKRQ